MKFTVRRNPLTLIFGKTTLICVLFVVAMIALFWVLWSSRPVEPGTIHTLFTIAAVAPLVGIVIAVLSLIAVIVKRSRYVFKIGKQQVLIRHSGVRFPSSELARVSLFSRDDRLYAMLVPRQPLGDPLRYTVEFPRYSTKKPHQLADSLERERPDVAIERLGSIA